jgi:uncharacterized membrane protein YfcA
MAGFLISLLIATLLGFLAGMGVGGGSLLLLWLTQVAMLEQTQARIINLLFFLPAALVATCFQAKSRSIDLKNSVTAAVTGCGAALLGTLLSRNMDMALLKKLLGGLLILTGVREIFYRPRNAK